MKYALLPDIVKPSEESMAKVSLDDVAFDSERSKEVSRLSPLLSMKSLNIRDRVITTCNINTALPETQIL